MKIVFNNGINLNIDNKYIEDMDDDDEAFYIDGTSYIYTIYKKDILYVIYNKD